ncbi:MAG: hypothetical protein R3284_09615, partial [Rubricoccaceae bacterium]|nr:hypothetical protein [Rubricoccaceae bacterium]
GDDSPDRRLALDELRFASARQDREQIFDVVARHGVDRIIWLEDLQGVNVESNPKLLKDVHEFYADRNTRRELGMFLRIDDIATSADVLLKACRNAMQES